MSTTLLLFDIDGTLIRTAGAGVRGMNAAFAELFGVAGALDGIPVAGRTDRAVVREAFHRIGIEDTRERVWALRDRYVQRLSDALRTSPPEDLSVLPGVTDLLGRLEQDPRVSVGLLTGNFHEGARVKLTHFGLWEAFDVGAFGDDHVDRADLVPVALALAAQSDMQVSAVVVIGDTPLDVSCALAHGARALAVATGPYSVEQLCETGAHRVVHTLEELEPGWFAGPG